ncbi:alpha-ketoglutarate-dependent dioxygenase AlkB [Rhodococcus sp. 27YEA15]|uniref:alpha-ketoglutarate-dependent dioxygenase AlkB n=1 Tax=Rhodococcus sp. 27YEA15 TaxID=3156259 RepID=UPI003C7A6206
MSAAMQPSLFDNSELGISLAALTRTAERRVLGAGAWVDHHPTWLSGSEVLFDALADSVPWRAERRQMYERVVDVPRLVCFYRENESLPHPLLKTARNSLSRHYRDELGEPFVTSGLCYYRDGADSVAWHGDDTGRSRTENTMVAILSVGSARPLLLRPKGGGESVRFNLGHGDLLVMGGSCQRTWEHCVPKSTKSLGPRISIQFRPRGVR